VRVTLVVAVAKDDRLTPVAQPLFPRALASAQRLGARARWQGSMPVSALFSEERSIVVSHRLPLSPGETGGRWIVVPAELWTPFADPPQRPSVGLLPYPTGSADNRWTRRRQDRLRREKARGDHAAFSLLASHSQEHRAGNFVARSRATGIVLLEALQ
jgi:hypothetical protein